MNINNNIDRAYLAGFFDGEGSIGVYASGSGALRIRTTITSTNLDVLEAFQEMIGMGTVRQRKTAKSNHKDAFDWRLGGKDTHELLKIIRPFVRVKAYECMLGLEFCRTIVKKGGRITKRQAKDRKRIARELKAAKR